MRDREICFAAEGDLELNIGPLKLILPRVAFDWYVFFFKN